MAVTIDFYKMRKLRYYGAATKYVRDCLNHTTPTDRFTDFLDLEIKKNPHTKYVVKQKTGVYLIKLSPDAFSMLDLSGDKLADQVLRYGASPKFPFSKEWKGVSKNEVIKGVDHLMNENILRQYLDSGSAVGIYVAYDSNSNDITGLMMHIQVRQDKNMVINPVTIPVTVYFPGKNLHRYDSITNQSSDLRGKILESLGYSLYLKFIDGITLRD